MYEYVDKVKGKKITTGSNSVSTKKKYGNRHRQRREVDISQLYPYRLGGVKNDSGTEVKTGLIVVGDTNGGSPVSVLPNWWPQGPARTAEDFVRENFVQGHLLNEKLGGPGNTMQNLTPLTRSTNSQMSASLESLAKKYLQQGYGIKYWVQADYSSTPTVADVGAAHLDYSEKIKLQQYLNKMPGKIWGQITLYAKNLQGNWQEISQHLQPKGIEVKNEGAHLKGTYI